MSQSKLIWLIKHANQKLLFFPLFGLLLLSIVDEPCQNYIDDYQIFLSPSPLFDSLSLCFTQLLNKILAFLPLASSLLAPFLRGIPFYYRILLPIFRISISVIKFEKNKLNFDWLALGHELWLENTDTPVKRQDSKKIVKVYS